MFILSKEFRFEAAHQLPNHDGKCARLHGHSWKLFVHVNGENLQNKMLYEDLPPHHFVNPKAGMLIDYADIKAIVQPIIDGNLDHYYLNESLNMENPTSENIAKWLFHLLAPKFQSKGVELSSVDVEETCTSACKYFAPVATIEVPYQTVEDQGE